MGKRFKRDTVILVGSIVLVLITLIGSSYSFFFQVKKSDADNTFVSGYLEIEFESSSGVIDLSNTVPKTETQGESLTPYVFKVKNTGNLNYKFDLKLLSDTAKITEEGCEDIQLSHSFVRVKLNDNSSVLLSDITNGILAEELVINAGSEMTFELRVWLDENTTNEAIGKHFHGKIVTDGYAIDTDQSGDVSTASVPLLHEGLIPIKWDESNNIVKADKTNPESNPWYNYNDKMWANAVMVTSDTRETYINAEAGTQITESDILAYWVWIPRYRYKIFNSIYNAAVYDENGVCTENCPQTIEIEFENKYATKSTGTVNGQWLTHPAFTFGDTELSGFWVAKFETSVATDNSCYIEENEINCNKEINDLRIVPNVKSLRNQQLAYQYLSAQNFSDTTYLTLNGVNTTDSHLMKNTEWGAVAYLSHSQYGLNSELYMNNSDNHYTGRSGGSVGSGASGSAENITTYGNYTYDGKVVGEDGVIGEYASNVTLGTNASTTGNIYGVYDMSGGSWDRVMGNLEGYVGNTIANGYYSNFNGTLASGEVIEDGIPYPEEKYVDKYKNPSNVHTDHSATILGDATGEVSGWYTDFANFIITIRPWFLRSGFWNNGSVSGIFCFHHNYGGVDSYISFRPTLTTK